MREQAFISYVRSIFLQKDKLIFKLESLPLEAFATSLGLAGAPKIKFNTKQEATTKKNAVRQVEEVRAELGVANSGSESGSDKEENSGSGSGVESESEREEQEDKEEEEETTTKGGKVRSLFDPSLAATVLR